MFLPPSEKPSRRPPARRQQQPPPRRENEKKDDRKDAATSTAAATAAVAEEESTTPVPKPDWDLLLTNSQKNNVTKLKSLLARGVSPNHSNFLKQSALHVAAFWGNVESLQLLMQAGATLQAQNRISGGTALHCAVQSTRSTVERRAECATLLLEAQPGILWIPDSYGKLAMDYCDSNDENDEEGVMQNALLSFVPQHAIFPILEEGQMEPLQQMLQQEADKLRQEGGNGETKGRTLHLHQHCDYKTGWSPLLTLVHQIVQDDDHDDDESTVDPATSLQLLKVLLQHVSETFGSTAVQRAVCATPAKSMSLLFLEEGDRSTATVVNDDEEDEGGGRRGPAQQGDVENDDDEDAPPLQVLFQALYDARNLGSDNDNDSDKATHRVSIWKETLSLLMKHGAVMTAGIAPGMLHNAARRGKLEFLELLLHYAPPQVVNSKGRQGLTALHFAARSGRVSVLRFLLTLPQIQPCATDDQGRTPLDAARSNEKWEIVQLLEQAAENT